MLLRCLFLALVAFSAHAEEPVTIYRNLTVIDGTGAAPRPGMAIVVEGERIKAIVRDAELTRGVLATVHDMRGMVAIPGLIDAHVHYATDPDRKAAEALLKRNVYGGVTAVRDMAGDARELASLSRAALLQTIAAPDIFYSALVAGPSFFDDPRTIAAARGMRPGQVPWLHAVTEQSDLALVVAQARGTGATGLKIYANLPGPLVARLIAEARRQQFPVWTHQQVYPASPFDSHGATAVSHVCMVARFVREPGKAQYGHGGEPSYTGLTAAEPDIARYIAALAASGTLLDATLSVYAPKGTPRCPIELAGDITRAAHKAGVKIVAGTDTDGPAGETFPSLHKELALLVEYGGLTPLEAITAASANAAIAIGQQKDMGTLEPGKFANIAFLKDDPSRDIANTRSVQLTLKKGKPYPRSDYR